MKYDTAALKARGIMQQKQPDRFTVRLRITGGRLEAVKLEALAGIVGRYTSGHVHLTIRQGIEIPDVRLQDIEALCSDLAAAGWFLAQVGPCVRGITACQGITCRHGLIDSQEVAERMDERLSGRSGLPHKFKIGVTGCPNACIKPRENDLGVMGIARKAFHEELCNACGLCVRDCPSPGALTIVDGVLAHHPERCVRCGKCVAACRQGAWESAGAGYVLFAGGKMGKHPRLGEELAVHISDEDQLLDTVDATVTWYSAHGRKKERFADTIDRVGVGVLTAYLERHAGDVD